MKKLDDAMASHVAGMEKKFGKPIQEWIDLVVSWNEPKHMANVKRLKEEFGIGHGHAQMVTFLAKENSSVHLDDGDMEAQMLKGKEVWQPLHEKLKALVMEVSEEIEFSQKKTYLSLRTSKQIATMGPSSKKRYQLMINLKGVEPQGDLELMKPGQMCSHVVNITDPEYDHLDQLKNWIQMAYDRTVG